MSIIVDRQRIIRKARIDLSKRISTLHFAVSSVIFTLDLCRLSIGTIGGSKYGVSRKNGEVSFYRFPQTVKRKPAVISSIPLKDYAIIFRLRRALLIKYNELRGNPKLTSPCEETRSGTNLNRQRARARCGENRRIRGMAIINNSIWHLLSVRRSVNYYIYAANKVPAPLLLTYKLTTRAAAR